MKVTVNCKTSRYAPIARMRALDLASKIIAPWREFPPYTPNESDDSVWTLDAGNDWKMLFIDDTFELRHRYQINDRARAHEYSAVNEGVKSLAGWLAYRLDGRVTVDMELEGFEP